MTTWGCWGLRLACLDFPLMAPGTQSRLTASKMILCSRLAAQGHLEVLCSLDRQAGSVEEGNSGVPTTLTVPGWRQLRRNVTLFRLMIKLTLA